MAIQSGYHWSWVAAIDLPMHCLRAGTYPLGYFSLIFIRLRPETHLWVNGYWLLWDTDGCLQTEGTIVFIYQYSSP